MMADLFISHATGDDERAKRVYVAQTERGVSCWMAPDDIRSGDFAEAINHAISECKALAVIVSEPAERSEHVRREVSLAATRRKKILPLVFDEWRPSRWLEYYVSGDQLIECGGDSFAEGMDRVAAAVKKAPPTPTPIPPPRRWTQLDLLALFCVGWAVVAAMSPVRIGAIARTLIVAALLVLPFLRGLARTRGKRPLIRATTLFFLLLASGWILDRAFLRSVIRRTLIPASRPTTVLYEAPYRDLHDVHVKASPGIKCAPEAPHGATVFGWSGPVGEVTMSTFRHPDRVKIECRTPLDFNALGVSASPYYEMWEHGTVRRLRQLFVALGGLSWVGSAFLFWRRRSSP